MWWNNYQLYFNFAYLHFQYLSIHITVSSVPKYKKNQERSNSEIYLCRSVNVSQNGHTFQTKKCISLLICCSVIMEHPVFNRFGNHYWLDLWILSGTFSLQKETHANVSTYKWAPVIIPGLVSKWDICLLYWPQLYNYNVFRVYFYNFEYFFF